MSSVASDMGLAIGLTAASLRLIRRQSASRSIIIDPPAGPSLLATETGDVIANELGEPISLE